jgi:hypothetical protein
MHVRRLIPAYATEDDWAQLQGEFQLDTPVRVRIHKVGSAPALPSAEVPSQQAAATVPAL